MPPAAALAAELAGIEENRVAQLAAIVQGMLANRQSQLALLKEELEQTRGLVAEGYAPRNRQLELGRMVADTQAAIADLQGNLQRSQRSIAELGQRALQRKHEYRKEVGDNLAEIYRELQADAEKAARRRRRAGPHRGARPGRRADRRAGGAERRRGDPARPEARRRGAGWRDPAPGGSCRPQPGSTACAPARTVDVRCCR